MNDSNILSNKNEKLMLENKSKNRISIISLLLIPILIIIYSIFRERDNTLIDWQDIQVPLSDKSIYKLIKLPNKIEVLLISDNKTERSAVSLAVNAGAFYDTIEGLAHFCEHSIFLGSKKYQKRDEFTDQIYKYSGNYNAYTYSDKTVYFYSVENKGFIPTLPIFANMLFEPIFNKNYIQKEIEAINSEHDKNINNNYWIIDQIIKYQANKSHPYCKFFTGNKDTLENVDINLLQNEVSNYFNYFYIGKNMKLCLISNESIHNLELLTYNLFNFNTNHRIINNNKNIDISIQKFDKIISSLNNIKPYNKNLGKIIWYKSTSNSNLLNIFFPYDEIKSTYKTHPENYFKYLLNYQGENSLISFLKLKNLITDFTVDTSESYSTFSLLSINIKLTERGVENYEEVIKYIFKYIYLIQEKNLSSKLFIEIKKIYDINFNFIENDEPFYKAINASINLLNYDYNDIFYGEYKHSEFKPDLIRNYLINLNIKNSIILLSTNKNLTDTPLFSNEQYKFIYNKLPYYNNEYFTNFINNNFIKEINNFNKKNKENNLQLRPINNYLTKIKSLSYPCYYKNKNNCKDNTEYNPELRNYLPLLIENNSNFISYYKIDKSFYLPKINLFIKLSSSKYFLSGEIINEIYLGLLLNIFSLKIDNKLSEAFETNNPIILSINSEFISIKLQCFTDLCENLSNELIKIIFNFNLNENELNLSKSLLINNILEQNSKLAIKKNKNILFKLIIQNYIYNDDLLNQLQQIKQINLNNFIKFYNDLLNDLELILFIHGNTNIEQSKKISNLFNTQMKKILNNKNIFINKKKIHLDLNLLNTKNIFNYYTINKFNKENNHATSIYYQIGKYNYKSILLLNLFDKCIGNLFFNELRTDKQLGYIANNNIFIENNFIYFSIYVQGTKNYPDQIEFDINLSIQNAIEKNCFDNFNDIKNNLINDILLNENNLFERTEFIFKEIQSGNLMFDKKLKLINELNNINSYQDVLDFVKDVFIINPKRINIFNYAGIMNMNDVENRINILKNSKFSLNDGFINFYSNNFTFINSFQ